MNWIKEALTQSPFLLHLYGPINCNPIKDINTMELFILIGGLYALYTVGMAIATELDYRAINKKRQPRPSISLHIPKK